MAAPHKTLPIEIDQIRRSSVSAWTGTLYEVQSTKHLLDPRVITIHGKFFGKYEYRSFLDMIIAIDETAYVPSKNLFVQM
jgi:hypothetical protein